MFSSPQGEPPVLRPYKFSTTESASFTTDLFGLLLHCRHLINLHVSLHFHIDSQRVFDLIICTLIWDYFIAFRRLAPVIIYMLTHYDREYEELQLTLCSLRMFLVKCGMIATQVQNLGLCVEGVCETRAHFPQSVDTATFPLRFRWLKAQD
jgi:hypothetical protein